MHDVPYQAYQPSNFSFPRREFGKSAPVKRSFQASWFNRWKWLHYDVAQDAAYCFTCCKATEVGKIRLSACTEESFVVKGFLNWKDATRAFVKHESCNFHKSAAAALASRVDITDMLSKQAAAEKQENRQYCSRRTSRQSGARESRSRACSGREGKVRNFGSFV